jgi:aminomethyltransferase
MIHSSLFEKHKKSGAQFHHCFGWEVPQKFSTIDSEYSAARNAAAIMERPYFARLQVAGKDCVDLLHRITTNELRPLKPGEGQINIFANEKGRIIDRVILLKSPNSIQLITGPGNAEKVSGWIEKYIFIEDVKVERISNVTTLSLFGPASVEVLSALFANDFSGMSNYEHRTLEWREGNLLASRTDELAIPGFDLCVDVNQAEQLWDELITKGEACELRPMGESAYDVLRIEAGWPIYGKDFDEEINPHEAGMLPYINFNKGCYIGQEVIARLDTYDKVQKHLMGILLEGDMLPASRAVVFAGDHDAGFVTSACHSISLHKKIAMASVRTKFAVEGTTVAVVSGDTRIAGQLAKLPFFKLNSK